ncbi:MAG: hypothetical protein MHM6MM_001482 [Cercozoa sp. M6MM]
MLGDLGAEVIKIERPGRGDDTRHWGPPFVNGESAYFLQCNRNKKSVAIDLSTREGVKLVRQLATKSDVVLENFRADFFERQKQRLGSDALCPDALISEKPSLIWCSISGYGREGPMANTAGYDAMVQAGFGMSSITGEKDGAPVKVGVAVTDLFTANHATIGILAALLQRQHTGIGQRLECSLMASQLASLANVASDFLLAGKEGQRLGSAHASIVPYEYFACKDEQYLALGAANDAQFAALCEILGIPLEERFDSNAKRVANRTVLLPQLRTILLQKTAQEWEHILDEYTKEHRIGPVYQSVRTVSQALSHPQVEACNIVREMEHSTCGTIKYVAPPFKAHNGDTFTSVRQAPPVLGEHTNEVLSELLQLDGAALQQLQSEGIVQ